MRILPWSIVSRPAAVRIGGHGPLLLAAAMLMTAVLRPPELHAWSGAMVACLAAGALWLFSATPGIGRGGAAWLWFAPFALVALRGAANRSAANDEAALVIVLLLVAACGRSAAADSGDREAILRLLVVLAIGVGVHAFWQTQVVYPRLAAEIRIADPADPTGVLVRVESGRASGPFLLPAALGGFLAIALPAALRGVRAWSGLWRAAAITATILIGAGFVLGRSMGAILAAVAGLIAGAPLLAPQRPARASLVLGAAGLVVAIGFAASRLTEIRDPAGDPFGLRAGNWAAAASMVRDAPWFGTGPGSFATVYPRYRQPGMNESRHAHNLLLEAAAGWGAWILVPFALLIAAWWRETRRAWEDPGDGTTPAFVAAGSAFLFHNLVDFTAYLPGVAIPAALMIGAAFGVRGRRPEPGSRSPSGRPAGPDPTVGPALLRASLARAAGVALAVMLALHGVNAARSRLHFDRAVEEVRRGEVAAAARQARAAADLRPDDPAPLAFLSQMAIAEATGDDAARAAGASAAAGAVARDPEAAILHYTLAIHLRAAGEEGAAFREMSEARRLNPLKALYRPADPEPSAPARGGASGDPRP
jgi:O-antigen ligase